MPGPSSYEPRCSGGNGKVNGRSRHGRSGGLKAEAAFNQIEQTAGHVQECLELFTPTGQLNSCSAARAKLDQWLPRLTGAPWAKTVRLLQRPESLTFLARVEQQLAAPPLSEHVKQDALRFEGLRRRPQLLEGEDQATRAARGWWLLASVRYHRDQEFREALSAVRGFAVAGGPAVWAGHQ
jgi:hypothetical protein